MYKKIIFAFFLCCASTQLFAQVEFRSGLILSGGVSHIWNKKLDADSELINAIFEIYEGDVKFTSYSGRNAALGYKFRLEPKSNRFFYDIDYFLGFKKYDDGYLYKLSEYMPDVWAPYKQKHFSFYTSLNPSANYRINNYFYAGVGLEPTIYSGSFAKNGFDMPFTTKMGVNLKYVELAISYKIGFLSGMKSEYFKSLNLNDLQLQLYIPF